MITLGEYLKRKAMERGWSISDLAFHAGIAKGNLSDIIRGKTSPKLETLETIASAFGIGAGDMLIEAGYTVNPKPEPYQSVIVGKVVYRPIPKSLTCPDCMAGSGNVKIIEMGIFHCKNCGAEW